MDHLHACQYVGNIILKRKLVNFRVILIDY